MKNIFLSSASKDHLQARGLYSYLASKKIKVWCNSIDKLQPGDNYKKQILKEVDNSYGSILLVSQAYLDSDFVTTQELDAIFAKKKENEDYLILPLLLEGDDIDFKNYKQISYGEMHYHNSKSTSLNSLGQAEYDVVCGVVVDQIRIYKPSFKREISKQEKLSSEMYDEFFTWSHKKLTDTQSKTPKKVQGRDLKSRTFKLEDILTIEVNRALHQMDLLARSTKTLKRHAISLGNVKKDRYIKEGRVFLEKDLFPSVILKNLIVTQREMFELLESVEYEKGLYIKRIDKIYSILDNKEKRFESDFIDQKSIKSFKENLNLFEKRINTVLSRLDQYGGNTKLARQCFGMIEFQEHDARKLSKITKLNFYRCRNCNFYHLTNKLYGKK